jgi:hypothetical protein
VTPDVDRLRASLTRLRDVLERIGFEFVGDPSWPEPSDTSYLNDADRANPDIMANVDAMDATNKLIAWFGRDDEGFVGLWRGPANVSLPRAPVVRLDTEGQYSLVAATVPDYLAISADEDDFDETRDALVAAGFAVAASPDEIWSALAGLTDPNVYRHGLYNDGRVRRGLAPIR